MKNQIITLLLLVTFTLTACDDGGDDQLQYKEAEVTVDSIPTLHGRFIHLADAAVLKGNDFIYGVTLDSLGLHLAEQVKPYKKESFDMVPVVVKAKVMKNPMGKGWDQYIEIREIIEAPAQSVLKKNTSEE